MYGLAITNPSGNLVVSADALGMYCVGKCTLVSGIIQPSGIATGPTPGRRTGFSTYRISHPYAPAFAFDLPLGKKVGIRSVAQSSPGVWDVTMHCGDTPDADGFDTVEYQVDVWAYSFAPSVLSAYGLALYQTDGTLAWDFSRPNPLFPRAFHNIGAPGAANTITVSLSRPVAMGGNPSKVTFDNTLAANSHEIVRYAGCLQRTSSTVIWATEYTDQRYRYNAVDPFGLDDGDRYDSNFFLLEGSTLP